MSRLHDLTGDTSRTLSEALVAAIPRRVATLLEEHPHLVRCLPKSDEVAAIRQSCGHTISIVEALCDLYRDRPAMAWRPAGDAGQKPSPAFTSMTYGALWQRVGRLATALFQRKLAGPGLLVGIWGHASPGWLAADLACLYNAATAAPLQTNLPLADLVHLVESDKLGTIICSTRQLARMAELVQKTRTVHTVVVMDEEIWPLTPALHAAWKAVEAKCTITRLESLEAEVGDAPWAPVQRPGENGLAADTLVSLLYTSGSTGFPKGAMFTDRLWRENFCQSFFGNMGAVPWVHYAYLPLNHLAGLGVLFSVMSAGGVSYFTSHPDMSHLFEDVSEVRPTVMLLVPRLSSLIYQQFRGALAKNAGPGKDDKVRQQEAMAQMRHTLLGDRLVMILLGTAPTSDAVQTFLQACFEVPVFDTFGQTENGGILFAGRVLRTYVTEYKLKDVPELGYFTSDKPYPRGELLIKSKRMIAGYHNNPKATAALFDADGFMKTGDIMEEREPDCLVWIDRKRNILKLAQGEFVSLSRLENIYTDGSPLVSQLYMAGKSSSSYLLAVVCPAADMVAAQLEQDGRNPGAPADVKNAILRDLARVAQQHGLAGFEIPRDMIVFNGAFTRENGLLTDSNKPSRPHLGEQFGAQLDAMFDAIDTRQQDAVADLRAQALFGWSNRQKLLHAVGRVLGIEAVDENATFTQLGGDSIAAVTLGELLEEVCGMTLSAGSILDPSATLKSLAQKLGAPIRGRPILSFNELHPHPEGPSKTDLVLERVLPANLLRPGRRAKTRLRRQIKHVFLTGATGFLGRSLLSELLLQAQRTGGHVTCLVRAPDNEVARARLATGAFANLATPQLLTVLAGDFAQPDFGLPNDVFMRLAKHVDCVVHNGALVNHAYNYEQEFTPNVAGTVEVIRFALHGRRKILNYVSSVAVTQNVQRHDTLLEKENPADWWPDFPPEDTYAAGYGTSKWVCEVLLRQLHDICGIQVNIFRPSMILGHSRLVGQINTADVFTRWMVSLIATRVAPPSFFVDDYQGPKRYDGLPVDFVATAMAALAVQSHGPVQSYNVVNPYPNDLSLDAMVQGIESAGYPLQRIDDYDAWYALFCDKLRALPEAQRQHTLLPLVEMWRHPAVQAPPTLGTAQFRRDVALMTPHQELPHLDNAFLLQTLRHLRHCELIPTSSVPQDKPTSPVRPSPQNGVASP